MNMIEKVARALATKHYMHRFNKSANHPHVVINVNDNWHIFSATVKDVIEAMREPSEAMLEAIDDSYNWDSSDLNGKWYIASADPKTNWQAGIDAALKEE